MNIRAIVVFAALALCAAQSFSQTHTVTFRRMNGTVLSKVEVEHGGSVALPEAPAEADHTFKGWDHGEWLGCVTNDIQVYALYEGTKTWENGTNYGSKSITFRDEPYSLDEYFKMYDNLAWADEFSRSGTNDVNRDYWNYDTENRHELNYETAGDNQKEHDGNLTINVRREKRTRTEFDWSTWTSQTVEYDFTGGGLKSNGKVAFKYGRCEIRAKLTRQKGCWPAFWMMGNTGHWPECGELDILEQPSGGDWIAGTLHIDPPSGSGSIGSGSVVTPQDGVHFGDGFHRFGTIMNEREVIWYVDDHIFKRMDVRDSRYHMCHDRPWFIIFGMGIQSNVWVKVPDAPATKYDVPELDARGVDFIVDYCRIFTNTNEGNTVEYQPAPAAAKLSAPVNATTWRGWDMCWGRTGSGTYQNNMAALDWIAEVDYIKSALTEYLVGRNIDVLTFLTEPTIATSQNRGQYDIPGYTMQSISFNGNQWNNWDNEGSGNMGRTQLFGNVLFNRERFSSGESGVDFITLSSDPAFTNCYAAIADLKEIATGARVKVVSVNVTTTNGIENAGGTVEQGFNTLFTKLNAMTNDNVIVTFQGMTQAMYNFIKARADAKLKSPYSFVNKVTTSPVYQCSYATANVSASAARPAKITVPKTNLTKSCSHNPQALQTTVTFDALPAVDDGMTDTFNASDYARSMDVTFSGYSGSTLANFPVLVKLSTAISGFYYSDFQLPNGGDLRFTDASGNVLPHEIDTWNPNGVSTAWVKVPSLKANTKIVAHFGCARPVRVDASQVWDDNYVGVWHLGESALPLNESSGVSVDFTHSTGKTIGYGAQGIVGGSVDFANGPSNAVVALDHDKLDNFSKFTLEAWTKQDSFKSNAGILAKREAYNKNCSYYFYNNNGTTALSIGTNNTGNALQVINNLKPTAGGWMHQVCTVDMTATSSNAWGYVNSVATAPKSIDFVVSVVSNRVGNLAIGNLNASAKDNSFNGLIDEVRISKCVRSADWIKATHDTVAKADFATYAVNGDVPLPEPQRILYVNVEGSATTNTLDAALVTENITNIVKQGAGVLVASAIPGYTGTITVEGGVWQGGASAGDFGGEGTVIDVLDGASLALRGANGNGLVENALSGKTVNLRGAKCSSALGKVVVSSTANVKIGAATVNLTDSDETLFLDKMGSTSWYFFRLNSGTLNLGGRTLVVSSSGANFETSATIENGGTVDVRNTMFAAEALAPSFTGTGTLKSNGTLNLKLPFSAQGWTVVGSPATLTGNVNRWPTDTSYPGWDGPISLSGNSKFANYAGATKGVSNTVFNAKGAISGSGTLGVGPGWLNLHSADNTYSGAVTVNGCAPAANQPVLPGGGGIGLWNGAACFPNASSVTFTNTARLAFMDNTACSVPNVKFVALAGETQSISGGVHTARSTMAGFVKEGAGTLVIDSPVSVTGLGDVKGGTLKVAYAAPLDGTQEGVLAQHPVFSGLRFASGTTLDLSDNAAVVTGDLDGSPSVVNSGIFGVSGKWTLGSPTDRLTVTGANAALGEQAVAGCLGFQPGATFEIPSDRDAAFIAAAESNGGRIEVAQANYVLAMLDPQTPLPMPTASSATNPRWSMGVGEDTRTVYLVLAPDSSSPDFAHAVDVTFSGYSGGSALTDFPVLVRLSPNITGFSYADFNLPNGGDLRFYDASGSLLTHEIDTWNTNGVSTVWVKVPTLTATTKITAKYGSTDTLPAVSAKDVWDDDYVGVWHLGESAVPMKESSETSSDFTTAYGSTIEYAADGVVGGSVSFPAGGQYNSLVAPDHDALDGFSQFTIETWTYQTEHKNNAGVLAKRAGFAKETAYYLFGVSTSTLSTMPLCVATNKNANVDWAYHQVQTLGAWNHLAYTVDMTKTTSNICGAKNGIMSTWKSSKDFHGTMANCASDLCLGNLYVNGKDNSFNGRIDEVRISKVIRSAAWIKATYETVMKPDFARYEVQGATALTGYSAWMNANELVGAPDEKSANGIANGVRYAFDIAPEKGPDAVGDPIIEVVRDANGNPSVQSRDLATGRDDVTFGILATPDLTDWSNAALVPMTKFATDGLWRPTASESSGYVFPSQMFFKYTIDIQ